MSEKNEKPINFDMYKATMEEVRAVKHTKWFQDYQMKEVIEKGFWIPTQAERDDFEKLNIVLDDLLKIEQQLSTLRNSEEQAKILEKVQNEFQKTHEQRLQDAKTNRTIRKLHVLQERKNKTKQWEIQSKEKIIFSGSHDPWSWKQTTYDEKRLHKNNLPIIGNESDLCSLLDTNIEQLRLLSYSNKLSQTYHYHSFTVPKKTGGKRQITAPSSSLKFVQRKIQEHIVHPVALHHAAHGFVCERSIVTNAKPHIGAHIVVNLDLKDFFPSIGYKRVRGAFMHLGYSEAISSILANICTEARVHSFEEAGEKWFLRIGEHVLPQGAPTSPAISNIICRQLDARLEGLAKKQGYTYTRYADDLSFSTNNKLAKVGGLLSACHRIIAEEGFVVHPEKTQVMRTGRCKEVTGIVVNEKSNVSKKRCKQFRAFLHTLEHKGLQHAYWEGSSDTLLAAEGFASFLYMVKGEDGKKILEETKRIVAKIRNRSK